MGNTTNLGYPYPDPTDRTRNGSVALRALAEAVDADVDWSDTVAHIGPADSPSAANGSVVTFPGGQSLMAGFTYAAGVLTYTGPATRMFLACVSVEVEAGGGAPASIESAVYLSVNGVNIIGSYDLVATGSSGTLATRKVVHGITNLLLLAPGDAVSVTATSTPAGTVGVASIKLQPLGGYQ